MGINSLTRRRRIVRNLGSLLLAVALLLTALAASASRSDAAPATLTFDNGRLTLGSVFNNRVVLPATSSFPSDDLPTPQRTDIQLVGDQTGGRITIPSSLNTGLQFPYMHLMHPLEPGLMIPVTVRLNAPGLSGTWDAATGAMTLKGKLDLIVVTGTGSSFPLPDSLDDAAVPPLGLFARCRANDVPVEFSTATQSPTTGEPFSGGFGKHGALTAAWDELPDATSENGGDCTQLNGFLRNPGGLWLSNGIVEPIPQKEPEETCETDPSLCPPPTYVEIDGVRLKPSRKAVKPGRKVVLKVRVHNSGNIPARKIKVKIKVNRRKVKAPRRIKLTVPAEGAKTKRFAVKIKRKARGRTVIVAKKNGWAGRSYLRIRTSAGLRRPTR